MAPRPIRTRLAAVPLALALLLAAAPTVAAAPVTSTDTAPATTVDTTTDTVDTGSSSTATSPAPGASAPPTSVPGTSTPASSPAATSTTAPVPSPTSTPAPTTPAGSTATGSTPTRTTTPRPAASDPVPAAPPVLPRATPQLERAVTPTTNQHALAAARWLGSQLQKSENGLFGQAAFPDYGLTMDAMFALAGAGVGADLVKQTGEKIWNSGEAYIDGDTQAAKNSRFAAIAKTALALDIAGYDPTRYPSGSGTRDLVADLRSTLHDDGSFGDYDFPFVHALAIYALARTPDGVPATAVSWLQGTRCTDPTSDNRGAYGYGGCDGVDADGTALAIQALHAAGVPASDPSIADAVDYLLRIQDPSGGVPSSFGGVNTNNSGLAAQALDAVDAAPAAVARMASFTAGLQVQCDTLTSTGGSRFSTADLGAIAYQQDGGFDSPLAGNEDQWIRAGTQAVFAFGLPSFDELTLDGAQAALPAAESCGSTTTPVTTPVTTPTSTRATTTRATPTRTRPATTVPATTRRTPATSAAVSASAVTSSAGTAAPGTPTRSSGSAAAPVASTTSSTLVAGTELTIDPVANGGTGPLAETGVSSATLTIGGLGLLAVLLGAALLLVGRRRTPGTHR